MDTPNYAFAQPYRYSCLWFGAAYNPEWTDATHGQSWVNNYCVFHFGTCLDTFEFGSDTGTVGQDSTYYISSMCVCCAHFEMLCSLREFVVTLLFVIVVRKSW